MDNRVPRVREVVDPIDNPLDVFGRQWPKRCDFSKLGRTVRGFQKTNFRSVAIGFVPYGTSDLRVSAIQGDE